MIVLSEQPIPVRQRKPDIPAKLAQIVDKAISKDIIDGAEAAAATAVVTGGFDRVLFLVLSEGFAVLDLRCVAYRRY